MKSRRTLPRFKSLRLDSSTKTTQFRTKQDQGNRGCTPFAKFVFNVEKLYGYVPPV